MALTKPSNLMLQLAEDFSPRPLQQTEAKTITVGSDVSTLKEAMDQLPVFLTHNFTVIIPSDDSMELEHLIVPTFYSFRADPEADNPRLDGGTLRIKSDDTTTPAYAKIRSLFMSGGVGSVSLQYLHTTDEAPESDFSAAEVRGNLHVVFNNFKVDASNGTAPIQKGITGYDGAFISTKGQIDFGTNQVTHAFVAKRGSIVDATAFDADSGSVQLSGTVDYAVWPQGGTIVASRGSDAGGSILTVNEAIAKGGNGIAYSIEREQPSTPSLRLENAETVQPFHWSHGGNGTISVGAGSTHRIGHINVYVPPKQVMVLKRANTHFNSGKLRIEVNPGGGLNVPNDYEFTSDETFFADPSDLINKIVADNSSGATAITGPLLIDVKNTDGGSTDIQADDNCYLEFIITNDNPDEFTAI